MPKIMFVEDDPTQLMAMARFAESEGYGVYKASNLDGAKHLLSLHQDIDCLVLDIWLAGESGIGALELAHELYPGMPVIVISGGNLDVPLEQTFLAAMWRGSSQFIFKPFDKRELMDAVRTALADGRA